MADWKNPGLFGKLKTLTGDDTADNDATTTNVAANRDGSVLERLEHIAATVADDVAANYIGTDDADNAAATTNVVANRDGSVLERMEHILDVILDDETTNLIGVNDADNAASTSSVVANEDGSIVERLEQIQEAVNVGTGTSMGANKSIADALGTNGVTLVDDAASVVGILGVNDADNAFASTSVVQNRDGSILERLEHLAQSCELCVEKSDGAVLSGTDDLFTITGGPVYAMVVGIVTTVLVGAANGTLQITTTDPAATVSLSTTVAIDNDASGTSYRFVGATGVLTPDTSGAKIIDPVTVADCWFLLPIGTVKFLGSAAATGVIKWYLRYKPLSPSSVVVAAA